MRNITKGFSLQKNKRKQMAKASGSGATKITFGKRAKGKAKKSWNKRDRKEREYRGQGR